MIDLDSLPPWKPRTDGEADRFHVEACASCFCVAFCDRYDRALTLEIGSPAYPHDLRLGADGRPVCLNRTEASS